MANRAERLRTSVVHKSLIGKRRVMGVPFPYAVMNFAGIFAVAWLFQSWPIAAIAIVNFMVMRMIFRKEPSTVEIYFRYIRQGERYEPWVHASHKDGRPNELIGRGQAW